MKLLRLKVQDENETTIIDCDFFSSISDSNCNCNTLILGENGVGKSFVLRLIADIFINLEKAKSQTRKPKFKYKSYDIDYIIGENEYRILRSSPTEIKAFRNDDEIDYKEIELPSRILAVSFMVNDKFMCTKELSGSYRYLGVRSSSNSTYTSSIFNKVYLNLVNALSIRRHSELRKILETIGFDSQSFGIKGLDNGNKQTIRYYLTSVPDDSVQYPINNKGILNLEFYRDSIPVSFETCSSGEKHLLFAFIGILSQIEPESLILIDEPEISLHPEWQIKYMSNIKSVFERFNNCHFLLASHSHFFVSDLPPRNSSIVVFRRENKMFTSELLDCNPSSWSAENIIYNVFGLRTTRNYYFERDVQSLIDSLTEPNKDYEKTKHFIDKLKEYSLSGNDPLNELIQEAEAYINVQ